MERIKKISYKKGKFNEQPFLKIFKSVTKDEYKIERLMDAIKENIERLTFIYDIMKKYDVNYRECAKMYEKKLQQQRDQLGEKSWLIGLFSLTNYI